MSSIRSGVTLQLGLVTCRVDVHGAIDADKEMSFNLICDHDEAGKPHDPSGVGKAMLCKHCQREASDTDPFLRGKVDKKSVTILDADEIAKIAEVPTELIESVSLTPHPLADMEQYKLLPRDAPYWLVPSSIPEGRTYNTVVEAMKNLPHIGLTAEWAPRTKVGLFKVSVIDNALCMLPVSRPEAVRPVPVIDAEPNERNIEMLTEIITNSVVEFNADSYRNDRKLRMQELIAAANPVAMVDTGDKSKPATGNSLEEMLQRAVKATAKAKPTTGATGRAKPIKGAEAPVKRAPAKKAAAKKEPVKA